MKIEPASVTKPSARRRGIFAVIAGIGALAAVVVFVLLWRSDYFWRNPIEHASYRSLTDFGENEAAVVSRDGQFVSFLSNRSGHTDVWVTQVGAGQFHNLTQGIGGELANPAVRTLTFSPDGTRVAFWRRSGSREPGDDISIWTVPTLGGMPTPYLEGVAEVTWSPRGDQIAYHTPLAGDPLFVSNSDTRLRGDPIMVAPQGLHSHFPYWSADNWIYFVRGTLPDQLDVWRIRADGEGAERITFQPSRRSFPVMLDGRTLLYLASEADGPGSFIYGMDVDRRVPHRLTDGVEEYTSLSASRDGQLIVATVSEPEHTLWRAGMTDVAQIENVPARVALTTGTGLAPRLGPGFLLYIAVDSSGESIWKSVDQSPLQLWRGKESRIIGGPALSRDGQLVSFTVSLRGETVLYAMRSDGSHLFRVCDSLKLRGSPAWAPDNRSILSAAEDHGLPHIFRISLDGAKPVPLLQEYSVDPAWSVEGQFVVYSGPDVGIKFDVGAATTNGSTHPLPKLTLTRGARHVAFLPGGERLLFLQGEIQHKDLWTLDLTSGALHQVSHFPADFDVRDFDVSPDGHEVVLERAQSRSKIVMIDRRAGDVPASRQ